MTGFSSIPLAEEGGERREGAHLARVAKILRPRWAQLPAIAIGLLGVQVFWSVEMSYGTSTSFSFSLLTGHGCKPGTPYLLSLGLLKTAVSLVFLTVGSHLRPRRAATD